MVSPASVGEQMLYEIGDPQAYLLPDVICDFSDVRLEQAGPNRVRVTGAKGRAPTGLYKVSATWADGYRAGQIFAFEGPEAREKAEVFAKAVEDRARAGLRRLNAPDFAEISAETIGGAGPDGYEEVSLKIACRHADARGVGLYLKEAIGLALSAPPGLSMFAGARPKPSPVVRLFSFAVPAAEAPASLDIGDPAPLPVPEGGPDAAPPRPTPPDDPGAGAATVPLIRLAWARSGDKGDKANIGVLARRPEYLPWIWAALTEEAVAERFARFGPSRVERFLLPGCHGMNLLLHDVLGGGGVASLRADPQAKGYSQRLLAMPIPVSEAIAEEVAA